MTAHSFNIFIVFTLCLSFSFHPSHGFEVFQPKSRAVNPDGSTSVSCEHNANVTSVKDVRLNAILTTYKPRLLCQKGKKDCKNIIMHQVNLKRWLFILLDVGPEAMKITYQCEFTVIIDELEHTKEGTPTRLLPVGQKEGPCTPEPPPSPPPPPPPPPPCLQFHQLRWILIGLLALMFLYSCIITCFYIRLRSSDIDPENSVYVEMRKAPQQMNSPFDIYCG
ncbi:uncharacterized protein LOC126393363 isoform X1 [Epinephelus moara]|uniref:uncharacterized protein LOC126393363 isoform X1 n=1 Tax=Epinephelus moara TaxID=300413 RepID=UPI00214EAA3A|nr:uncharacterized protein LOC126393363 isoform X1 [Epinephelus moara]